MIDQYRTEVIQRGIIFTWEVNLGLAVHQHGCSPGCGLQFLCFVYFLFILASRLVHMRRLDVKPVPGCGGLCNLPALTYTGSS